MFLVSARAGGRRLLALAPSERAEIISSIASSLITRKDEILEINKLDIHEAKRNGLDGAMLARLALTPGKLQSLSAGIEQVFYNSRGTQLKFSWRAEKKLEVWTGLQNSFIFTNKFCEINC